MFFKYIHIKVFCLHNSLLLSFLFYFYCFCQNSIIKTCEKTKSLTMKMKINNTFCVELLMRKSFINIIKVCLIVKKEIRYPY